MKTKRIIFLDIDGVLNSSAFVMRQYKAGLGGGLTGVCPELLAKLQNVISTTGAEVVISSTWRKLQTDLDRLAGYGLTWVDCTPILHTDRYVEIELWLAKNGSDVLDYVIIDDDRDANIEGHFYKTTWEDGLTDEICNSIIQRFGIIK